MRLMMLCTSGGHGGLELYAAEEVRQLMARGHECLPVVSAGSMLDRRLQEYNLASVHSAVINRRFPIIAAKRLAQLIDAKKIDLIHIHWNNDLNLAVLAKRFSKRTPRLVYSRHMAITRSKKDPLHRWFYREVDALIAVTRRIQQEAKTYLPLPDERIRQLYLGVAETGEEPADYDNCYNEDFPRRQLNLALFGRIEPYKGQHLLVSAVSQLVKQGLDVSATIIGHVMDEKYYAELQKSVKKDKLSAIIKFESFVSNPVRRMKCYDIVVLTTYCETFGLVLVEAMRAGVAVIGTNCGGVPEIIDDKEDGLLFTPGEVDELVDKIAKLYREPSLLNSYREKGRQKADRLFSQAKHFEKLEALLNSIG